MTTLEFNELIDINVNFFSGSPLMAKVKLF